VGEGYQFYKVEWLGGEVLNGKEVKRYLISFNLFYR